MSGAPPAMGSVSLIDERTGQSVRRSARLLASAGVKFPEDPAVDTSDITAEDLAPIEALVTEAGAPQGGKKRRQRGGAMDISQKLKYAKAIAMMVVYNSVWAASAGLQAAYPNVKDYIVSRVVTPLGVTTRATSRIYMNLADQIVQAGVTLVNLSASSLGYTGNVIAKIIRKFNDWGTATSATLLSDDYAQAAANSAVSTWQDTGATIAFGGFVLNQLGILPLSALLAGILFAIKANFGTGTGRAYVAASFYTWFHSRPSREQAQMVEAAKTYATAAAATGAAAGRASVASAQAALPEAVRVLNSLLAKRGGASGAGAQNAFEAVAADAAGGATRAASPASLGDAGALESAGLAVTTPAIVEASSAPSSSSSSSSSSSAAPLVVVTSSGPGAMGGPAFSPPMLPASAPTLGKRKTRGTEVGAVGAEVGAVGAEGATKVQKTSGGRKTKKRVAKRRVTRRRKAPKYLAAPVFGRKGATFAY